MWDDLKSKLPHMEENRDYYLIYTLHNGKYLLTSFEASIRPFGCEVVIPIYRNDYIIHIKARLRKAIKIKLNKIYGNSTN